VTARLTSLNLLRGFALLRQSPAQIAFAPISTFCIRQTATQRIEQLHPESQPWRHGSLTCIKSPGASWRDDDAVHNIMFYA
jgi:hypothetical protein